MTRKWMPWRSLTLLTQWRACQKEHAYCLRDGRLCQGGPDNGDAYSWRESSKVQIPSWKVCLLQDRRAARAGSSASARCSKDTTPWS
eukprot:155218-Pyramimonas_sp.AAC.1